MMNGPSFTLRGNFHSFLIFSTLMAPQRTDPIDNVPPCSVDGPGEVRAEDRHPAEHGHGEEVAEVAHSPAAH